ncbi:MULTISPECIES: Panacea domain-containing protein [unclassified Burkholderia]|uniref:Panacea domain-containing protein n=1 Tax=unclassified Burkholderia TaxID=2613784 RepID=UPI002ABE13EB|nr:MULTISPECIES: type II toxin-antitoxin system antitoxin SocA domain-containing protein [unclassified Burkholderia]
MTVSALKLSGEIIRRMSAKDRTVTNLSVQKLAYFCHGWHLALTGDPLVDEGFAAWKFGPVLPSVYHKLKVFSSNPIPASHPFVAATSTEPLGETSSQIIDKVLDVYGRYSGAQLVSMSHVESGPWHSAWEASSDAIENDQIETYFKSLIKR